MSDEREDLVALLTHPGWLRVKRFAEKQWGEELTNHLRNAVNDANDMAALSKMRQIIVAKDAVERLVRWPEERLSQLQSAAKVVTVGSRGGYGA